MNRRNINDWTVVTRGLYRYYTIGVTYELVIEKAGITDGIYDWENAIASICTVKLQKENDSVLFIREWILRNAALNDCLQAACNGRNDTPS